MNEVDKFTNRVNEELRKLEKTSDEFPWHDVEAYAEWLGQGRFLVRQATHLLSLAAAHFKPSEKSHHDRFLNHLREERGHDVMIERDLKELGRKQEDYPERAETSALYQVQFYWIQHVSAVAFYGYILCLEGLASSRGKKIYETICKNHGEKAGLFMKVHSMEDEDHFAKALEQLKKLTPQEMVWVDQNLTLTRQLYTNLFETIKADCSKKKRKAA